MARARSQRLVIDASVARAAGPQDAVHPTAKLCRDFLLGVLDVCHHAVFSSSITDEWRVHQSGFARQWRVAMFARKKIEQLDDPVNRELRRQIEKTTSDDKHQDAMLKDVHLIEAAFAAGLRVAALDEAVRACFRLACVSVPRLRSVCWINPANPQENPLGWLQTGAPLDGFRLLGYDAGEE